MIDIHTHLYPEKLFNAVRNWFAKNSPWHLDQPGAPNDVAQALKNYGVERFVFCAYAHRTDMARNLNTWLCNTAKELDRFGLPLLTVHVDDKNCTEDARLALADGCIGMKIHEDVQQFGVDDQRLDAVYSQLIERKAFVLAHIGPIPWTRVHKEGLARVKNVLNRHPNLKLVVAHMGVPDTQEYFELMDQFPNLYLDTAVAFSRMVKDELPIAPEILEKCSDRVIYGSDYPNTPFAYGKEASVLSALSLSQKALQAITHDNGASLIAPFV